jgi:intracellular sulfur oxidation DsrE/DsrF family protein
VTPISLVIHAPDPEALIRARSNARNLLKAAPDARCEIVVNAGAVAVALDQPDAETDPLLRICGNTLDQMGLTAPAGLRVVRAAVLHLAERQRDGWQYVRA